MILHNMLTAPGEKYRDRAARRSVDTVVETLFAADASRTVYMFMTYN